MKAINIKRSKVVLHPDSRRVLIRPLNLATGERAVKICARVVALPEAEIHGLLEEVLKDFHDRHFNIREFLTRRFEEVRSYLPIDQKLSKERELLIGAYFAHEYSFEAAALFNPSIVPHPDQSNVPAGSLRFVLSLRATGEGHISSITFRNGMLNAKGEITISDPARFSVEPAQAPNASYERELFGRKLKELGLLGDFGQHALKGLSETFCLKELRDNLEAAVKQLPTGDQETESNARKILALAQSNYEVIFPADSRISERVLFPATPAQANGIEDARFVQFVDDDGAKQYYATYTAYDGRLILPQFIETPDFLHFKFRTLNGSAVKNKGMALFPRKINGMYVMLGRQDYENIYIMSSDHLHFWQDTQILLKPKFPWEFIQMGNCGSPIETEKGWLVISHGVGAMRKYCIGAFLLDLKDPTKVIGRMRDPLIKPNENEREGYVPNVVYSCGSIVHDGQLVVPYAMSDYAATFAMVDLEEVLAAME